MRPRNLLAIVAFFSLVSAHAGEIETALGSGQVTTSLGSGTITKSVVPGSVLVDCDTPGTFFTHTFTESGSSTQTLVSSIPEVGGGTWSGTSASDGSLVVDRAADQVASTDASGITKYAYWSMNAICPNYSVTGIAKAGGGGSSHRVTVRGRWNETSGGNGYRFQMDGVGGLILESVVNGVATTINAGSIAGFSATTFYSLELRMDGSTIQGYIDGVLMVSATSTAVVDSGTVAFSLRNSVARMTSITAAYL